MSGRETSFSCGFLSFFASSIQTATSGVALDVGQCLDKQKTKITYNKLHQKIYNWEKEMFGAKKHQVNRTPPVTVRAKLVGTEDQIPAGIRISYE